MEITRNATHLYNRLKNIRLNGKFNNMTFQEISSYFIVINRTLKEIKNTILTINERKQLFENNKQMEALVEIYEYLGNFIFYHEAIKNDLDYYKTDPGRSWTDAIKLSQHWDDHQTREFIGKFSKKIFLESEKMWTNKRIQQSEKGETPKMVDYERYIQRSDLKADMFEMSIDNWPGSAINGHVLPHNYYLDGKWSGRGSLDISHHKEILLELGVTSEEHLNQMIDMTPENWIKKRQKMAYKERNKETKIFTDGLIKDDIDVVEDCSICFSPLFGNIRKLDCDHLFHESCINTWRDNQKAAGIQPTCPMCRAKFRGGNKKRRTKRKKYKKQRETRKRKKQNEKNIRNNVKLEKEKNIKFSNKIFK